jgi:hypothetical protein
VEHFGTALGNYEAAFRLAVSEEDGHGLELRLILVDPQHFMHSVLYPDAADGAWG